MISGRTRVLGILGDPVEQARAPAMVNAALGDAQREAVLVPMHVAASDLARAVGGLRALQSFAGAIVTMPHKIAITDLLDDLSAEARLVGACNVIRRGSDGTLVGTMLDGEGFVAGLRSAGHEVRGARVHLAGAGGAASAIAFALARHGVARLTIHNRTALRADDLAGRVATAWPACAVHAGDPGGDIDLVVNATSLGMGADDPLPVPLHALRPGVLAAEIVVARETTGFLAEAERRGCRVHPGRPMLAAQIALMIDFMLA